MSGYFVVQDRKSGHFWAHDNTFTPKPFYARWFESAEQAARTTELYLRASKETFVVLPLNRQCTDVLRSN